MERLQKVLAHAGVASRRKCEELIRAGRVQVNGQTVTELGVKVDPTKDRIAVDGKPVRLETRKRYILLYKPAGVITSVRDPRGRRTVIDLVKDVPERIYPVGRLDYETEGLLLLTNDGELAHRIMHPRYELDKVYEAWVKGHPDEEALRRLREGMRLEDGWTHPAKVERVAERADRTLLRLTIHEGRNRQVRRMCAAVGHPVLALRRVRVGFLTLDKLRPGAWRELTPDEVRRLKALVGL